MDHQPADSYKTTWNSGRLIIADRWYPSSKRCSRCGVVKTKLPLSERVFTSTECGLVLDRDENAASNPASLVEHVVAGSGPETENGRGAEPTLIRQSEIVILADRQGLKRQAAAR